jgi:peptide/nickel transport system substrate-binding protein
MGKIIAKIRALLRRVFFWHEGGGRSKEFTPSHAPDRALVLGVSGKSRVPRWRQLRYAGLIFNTRERKILLGAAAALVLAAGVGVWALASERLVLVPADGGSVTEAIIGSPKYINPLYAAANDPDADLTALVFAGLFRRVNGTTVVPDLAERFEWSEGGTRLTLTLRNEIAFHDGTPLTSEDVIFTLRAAKHPSWRSTYINAFRDASFEQADDRTVVITLPEPDAYLLDALTIGILPAHVWQDVEAANALLADANTRPIGAGPFKVRSFRRNSSGAILSYTLERYEKYHGIKPFLERIEFRFYPDRQLALDSLRNGQVDALAFVSGTDLERVAKNEHLDYGTLELPQETIAFMNVNDETLKDAKVRQALALAVDRDEIVGAQAGVSHPVQGPYPFADAPSASTSTAEDRMEEARALLEEAGWKLSGENAVRTKNGAATGTEQTNELSLVITVADVPDLTNVAEVLQRRWSLLGAKVTISREDEGALLRRASREHDSQILVWNVLLNSSQDLFPVWWSAQADDGLNFSNLKDRNVDAAIEEIHSATTTDALKQARQKVSDAVLARTPAVFLTRPAYGYAYAKKIKGVAQSSQIGTPSDRFHDLPNWHVKMKWKWK